MCREKVVTVVMTSSKDSSDKAVEAVRSTNDGFEDESDVVRDSLYALQGLPSAVRKLERLARSYNATSADKSSQNLTTLWTRSVTATALGKVLSLVVRAGHLRRQLDAFVNFFLDGRHDDWGHSEDNPRWESKSKKKKKKKKKKNSLKNGPSDVDKEENGGLEGVGQAKSGSGTSNPDVLSSRCLVNQAFAAAVKTVLRGHSAALNTLAASVTLRRLQDTSEHGFRAAHLRDQDPGPVIGYGCRDITLLEFYLHTRELRVQLQALAYICLRRNGKTFSGNVVGDDDYLEKWSEAKTKEKHHETGNSIRSQSDHARRDHTSTTSFEYFPRGAALLTYLYEQLMEVDPLHMELLRFLFERAYQPYSVFIRSWIYQAAVKDPFCEFVIEQGDFNRGSSTINARGMRNFSVQPTDLKLREGVSVPRFLEDVRIPLIRAGQQLQVLMKLAETCELAQQIGKTTNPSELFEGLDISPDSLAGDRKNSVDLPALVYSKMQLEETVNQRENNRKVLNEQFDNLFTELAARRLQMENKSPCSSAADKPPISSVTTNVDDKQLSADTGSESRQEAASPSLTIFPGGEENSGGAVDGSTGILKRTSGIGVGDEEIAPVMENHPESSSPDIMGIDITEPLDSTLEEVVPSEEKSAWYPTNGNDEFKELSAVKNGFCGPVESEHKMMDKVEIYEPFQVSNFQIFEPAKVAGVSQSPESQKLHVPSLISDHQRGASWPLWGLPTNPFLMPATVNDFTPHFYAYTSFAGTFHPWDVTTKLSRAGLNSTQTSALEESARKQAEISVEPTWFTSLELALKDQLFEGLNAHLLLLEWDKADHVSECDFGPLDSSKQSGNGWNTQLLVELDGRLTDPLNFSSSLHSDSETTADLTSPSGSSFLDQDILKKSSEKTQYIGTLESKANSNQGSDSTGKRTCKIQPVSELSEESPHGEFSKDIDLLGTSIEESELLNQELGSSENGAGLVALASEVSALRRSIERHQQYDLESQEGEGVVYEAFKWQQYLRFSESPFESAVQHCSDSAANQDVLASGEEIPLSVVVSKCVIQEILSQYESVSTLTVRLFHEGLCLQDHYHALRRYFFMERGDWADYFIAALCQNRWGPSGHQLRQMEVQGMLEAALQKSSCEGEEYAERLLVCFQAREPSSSAASAQGSTKISVAPFVDCSRLDAFDFISLEYRIDWPLTLVLTSHSLQLYNVIFSFLMRIKLAVYALADIWRRLQGLDKSFHKVRHSPQYQQQRNRFRTLQQLRQQIYHLVTTVQRYVESKLLYVVWSKFLHDIQLEVNDMQDLNALHCAYLEGAINECFLSPNTQGVKGCIDTIMQCVLDFLSHLKGASKSAGDDELIDDHLFAQVCQVNKVFQSSLQLLNIYHLKQEPQYRTNLSDLWMILDFNGFVTNAFFSD
ncbi:gamma-tubulin complex component 6 [Marchantia polymorpha subsp. ruderalis]